MKKKRNIKAIISIISILLIIGISGILAYLTDADKATNTFTVGEVKIELQEPNWDPNNAQEIVSNGTLPKDPQVKNTGKNNAYIYLKVTVPTEELIAADETGVLLNNGLVQETQLFTYEINENWTELEKTENVNEETGKIESYTYVYYYNTELEPEATTETIFDEVKFANVIEGQVDLQEKQIDVQAYAIQSNNLPEGTTIETAYEIYVNQNGEGEEGEVVEQQRLADMVEVGDYVNYDASSNGVKTFTSSDCLAGSSISGTISTADDFNSEAPAQWRVLSVDKESGLVELMAADPTAQTVTLSGGDGFANAETVLNNIGIIYGQGDGATGGRSIKLEDINQYSTYVPEIGNTGTYTSGNFYKEKKDENGNVIGYETIKTTASSSSPINMTQTYYNYSATSYFSNTIIYNMIFKNSTNSTVNKVDYWLASRCVRCNSDNCEFFIRYMMGSASVLLSSKFYDSNLDYVDNNYPTTKKVIPVVSLESNILTSGQDESGAWNLVI